MCVMVLHMGVVLVVIISNYIIFNARNLSFTQEMFYNVFPIELTNPPVLNVVLIRALYIEGSATTFVNNTFM